MRKHRLVFSVRNVPDPGGPHADALPAFRYRGGVDLGEAAKMAKARELGELSGCVLGTPLPSSSNDPGKIQELKKAGLLGVYRFQGPDPFQVVRLTGALGSEDPGLGELANYLKRGRTLATKVAGRDYYYEREFDEALDLCAELAPYAVSGPDEPHLQELFWHAAGVIAWDACARCGTFAYRPGESRGIGDPELRVINGRLVCPACQWLPESAFFRRRRFLAT